MKKMKRMMALLLAVIMTLAMGVSAFAADAKTGSLTVKVKGNNTLHNQTLRVYKLFDLTVSADKANYAYTVNGVYRDTLIEVLELEDDATDVDIYEAVKNKESEIATFAEEFTKEVLRQGLEATKSVEKLDNVTEHTFKDLDYGYYLVHQTGTKKLQSSLVNVDQATDTEVELKGEAPSIEKDADVDNVQIGDVVTYTIKGTVPDTTGYDTYTYILHDKLSDGLDFVRDKKGNSVIDGKMTVEVKLTNSDFSDQLLAIVTENYKKMELDLSEWIRENVTNAGREFIVTYYAKVNSDAVVGNTNSAKLEYGNNPDSTTETIPVEVKTPTFPLYIKKTDAEGDNYLSGAKFQLRDDQDNVIRVEGSGGEYRVAENQKDSNMLDVMETESSEIDNGGYNLTVNGLKAGTYWLEETEAPDGYNKLKDRIKVVITQDKEDVTKWTISVESNGTEISADDKIITVVNKTGTVLPGTGGMGTMIFTVVALVLVLGVAVSFVISRRKTN